MTEIVTTEAQRHPADEVRLHLERARQAQEEAAEAWARAYANLRLIARLLRDGRI